MIFLKNIGNRRPGRLKFKEKHTFTKKAFAGGKKHDNIKHIGTHAYENTSYDHRNVIIILKKKTASKVDKIRHCNKISVNVDCPTLRP